MMQKEVLHIKSVNECNRYLGCQTLHPQAGVFNLENPPAEQLSLMFDFYAILLVLDCEECCCCCGRKHYDYCFSTMIFLKPGELFCMSEKYALPKKGWLLTFHPDLLFRTDLKRHIDEYSFFSYRKDEALHLSKRETETIECCLENIEEELHHAIDTHTATILSRHIELLLDYSSRFYERQFITREDQNKALLEKMDRMLGEHISSGRLRFGAMPDAEDYAAQLKLSAAYFNDLVEYVTGSTFEENFEAKRLTIAKRMLLDESNTPAHVARHLGYASVQQFCFIFKKITGNCPTDYRLSKN